MRKVRGYSLIILSLLFDLMMLSLIALMFAVKWWLGLFFAAILFHNQKYDKHKDLMFYFWIRSNYKKFWEEFK